jgi:hypothetical protein
MKITYPRELLVGQYCRIELLLDQGGGRADRTAYRAGSLPMLQPPLGDLPPTAGACLRPGFDQEVTIIAGRPSVPCHLWCATHAQIAHYVQGAAR